MTNVRKRDSGGENRLSREYKDTPFLDNICDNTNMSDSINVCHSDIHQSKESVKSGKSFTLN